MRCMNNTNTYNTYSLHEVKVTISETITVTDLFFSMHVFI